MASLSLKNWQGCKEELVAAGVKLPAYDVDAVKAAVADGTLSQARIDESVLRILTVQAEYGIIS